MAEIVVMAVVLMAGVGMASGGLYSVVHATRARRVRRRDKKIAKAQCTVYLVPKQCSTDASSAYETEASLPSIPTPLSRSGRLRRKLSLRRRFKRTSSAAAVPARVLDDGRHEVDGCVLFEADTCPICLEVVKAGEKMAMLPCLHAMHMACAQPWLVAHATCPLCKAHLDPQRAAAADAAAATAAAAAAAAADGTFSSDDDGGGGTSDDSDSDCDSVIEVDREDGEAAAAVAALMAAFELADAVQGPRSSFGGSSGGGGGGGGVRRSFVAAVARRGPLTTRDDDCDDGDGCDNSSDAFGAEACAPRF
ncbi:hypothetical protein JKP88DRAFT_335415 [Tribonema minus]|uniref:RING-type domain-containing protein n=1 Tax=Tribonema minus TaxID=303371 RepID=A0A835YMX8_9STRA|nr:hypothetical protein JKP88DRAFT_335415 [Tribonema minus]